MGLFAGTLVFLTALAQAPSIEQSPSKAVEPRPSLELVESIPIHPALISAERTFTYANLTSSDTLDVVVVTDSGGGSCGNYIEVWRVVDGLMREIELPMWNCGWMKIDSTRGGLERLTFKTRTYEPDQKTGGPYTVHLSLCFSGVDLQTERYWYVTVEGDVLGAETPVSGVTCR